MRNTYSEEFKRVLVASRTEALRQGNKTIRIEHFILGMLREPDNDAHELLLAKSRDIEILRIKMSNRLTTYGREETHFELPANAINLDMHSGFALQNSMEIASAMNMSQVTSGHLLLSILRDKDLFVTHTLAEDGLTYDYARDWLRNKYNTEFVELDSRPSHSDDADTATAPDADTAPDDDPETAETQAPGRHLGAPAKKGRKTLEFLKRYGTDLTLEALQGKLDPVVGRTDEIQRLAQILIRRKKNNPVLVGDAGVGKTAIVEGLAQRIVKGEVPVSLLDKRLIALNLTSVVAGTKYRGQFEERMQGIMKELENHPDVIVFIDEIHTLIGAGGAQGSMDAANILKPALSRGKMQCIGATTMNEYHQTIEKDGAMERRFQKVTVNPTTPVESIEILRNIKSMYEEHHNVTYTDRALELCVRLTERYISDRKLPDKAIDALDEAGSRKHMTHATLPDNLKELEQQIDNENNLRDQAAKEQNFEEASRHRDHAKQLKEHFTELKAQWLLTLKEQPAVVDADDVERVVSVMSGVPAHKMAHSENVKLKELRRDLQHTIIAQDKAIDKLVKAITRNRIGLRDPKKPVGTFLFLGPTGVGKTFLAKKLADYMFGSEDALIRIDMSEYRESYTISRLVGASPGYVGYEEGGQLTERVRRRPYSIVLFDEIEKAHPDIFNILLQVLDEGRLTDNSGVTVDFKNTIIILTSNCGSRELLNFGNSVGFATHSDEEQKAHSEQIIMKALNRQFAPEFINRIDDIILFDNLNKDAISQIVDNELAKLNLRLMALGFSLDIDKTAKDFLVDKSFDKKYGARPLKRAIQTYVEDGISEYILDDEKSKDNLSGVIHITKGKQELVFE